MNACVYLCSREFVYTFMFIWCYGDTFVECDAFGMALLFMAVC